MTAKTLKDSRPNRHGLPDQVRTLIRHAREVAEGLPPEDFDRRPEQERWSVAECLDHLNETARVYLPVITDAVEEARAKGLTRGKGEGRTLIGRIVVRMQEPPARFRTSTFEELEPTRGLDRDTVLEEFETLHEELIVRMNESGDLDRKKIKIRSVLDPRLRLSLGDWFAFLAAHGRRHVWQAERVRDSITGRVAE